ncbi:TIGR00159 family protein [Candidatus Peregrinibacteria bacterium]|nr:TIGR00159 family protein [Candidatus Peregrinibacteria bacterium]
MESIGNFLAGLIINVGGFASDFWQNLAYSNVSIWMVLLDILLVSMIIYYLFSLLKGSRSISILLGLIFILIVFSISKALNLLTLGWLLDRALTVLLVAIPVIFQPELRMTLEKLGNRPFFNFSKTARVDYLINELVETTDYLSKYKIGALIVIKNVTPLKEYIETGTVLNADISKHLLISIFQNKSPLHDGAVIIENDKIVSAGSTLPTTFTDKNKAYGTRHKAAIALSEQTDAYVIVISEERGFISFAKDGKLEYNLDLATLQYNLNYLLKPKNNENISKSGA